MAVDKGARLGHYEVVSALGRGGMGEVYLARDTRLDRRVALKVLPAEFAADSDRLGRFIREAKSASALNHPNIITIYDIGDASGTPFIAYEFIDGTTLTERVGSGSLNVASSLDIAIQVASALVEAHHAGIVHRDLKPDNVMVRPNGLVKLLDFGIARVSKPPGPGHEAATAMQVQTQAGVLIGTPLFMSPEQARGTDVDHRTDIFSFGAVLYEMLSGVPPFAAETVSDVIAAVLIREPSPLAHVPPRLAAIVTRALQKDRARRYQTAADLQRDLVEVKDSLAAPGGITAIAASTSDRAMVQSVAVLPFVNMSANEDDEYFCDGLAEELLNALSKIDALKVAARTSAFSFKGKSATVSAIGTTLGVTNVVEGSIRRAGNRVRISVQLINAADGYHLWSERYDREMRDIFALQDDITLDVVEALKVTLFGDEKAAALKRHTEDAEAYELFLKGRYHSYKYTAQGWKRAIEFFEKAIDKQPGYALAYAGIAASRGCQWFFGILPAEQTVAQSQSASRQALSIDGGLADAYLSLALMAFLYEWDWQRAEQEFRQSITLNPNNAEALSYYAMFLAFAGRADEAVTVNRKALTLDPLAPLINMNGGWTYFSVGMLDEASAQAAKMIESDPDFYGAYWLQGAIHLSRGEFDRAVEQLKAAVSLGGHHVVVADLASACSLAGRDGEAAEILRGLSHARQDGYVPAICLARIYSRLGDAANAVEWLETAFAERNGEMVFLRGEMAGAADGDPLRLLAGDPRVTALLQAMHLP